MKKPAPKKSRRAREDRPIEFSRGWQELENQYDRMSVDWGSLAAQLNVSPKSRDY